ncbi:acyl-CoA dehydrogenase family protein [Pseudomonas syringae]|uniref:acyl-CoA dehydrogenase family protein n=1 Tax=Pseudomonas syringae TaxID=317 RepID=UPI003F74CF63
MNTITAANSAYRTSILDRARSMESIISSRTFDIEAAKNLPPDIVNSLAESGFFKMLIPEEYGGLECDPEIYVAVIENLARHDASVAWCTFIYCTSSLLAAYLPSATASKIFSARTVKMSGVFAPNGQARRTVEQGVKGYRVTGKWAWGSGSKNADYIMGGCLIIGMDGQPERLPDGNVRLQSIIFQKDQVHLLDNWTAFGLKGTGSGEFQVTDQFVPADYTACLFTDRLNTRPLYNFPIFGLLGMGIAGVALGLAHAAIRELKTIACVTKTGPGRKAASELATTQVAVAKAEAKLRSSKSFLLESIRNAWTQSKCEQSISIENRSDIRLATTHAVDNSVDIIQSMYAMAGGVAILENSKLQKHLRDVSVLSKHIMISSTTYELIGSISLGLKADTNTL